MAELAFEDGEVLTRLFLKNATIRVTGDRETREIAMKGTPNNEAFGIYQVEARLLTELTAQLKTDIERAAAVQDMDGLIEGFKRLRDADMRQRRLDSMNIAKYKDLDFGVYLLSERTRKNTITLAEVDSMIAGVPVSIHSSPFFRRLEEQRDRLAALAPGGMAPQFEARTPDGKMLSTASFRGQYLLVEFWASWCAPCRGDITFLKSTYETYHNFGFEILGVSLDDSVLAWHDALTHHDMPWPQVSDLIGMLESPIAELYRIVGIPSSWLLDPEGQVIARDLRRGKLDEKLEEIFRMQ